VFWCLCSSCKNNRILFGIDMNHCKYLAKLKLLIEVVVSRRESQLALIRDAAARIERLTESPSASFSARYLRQFYRGGATRNREYPVRANRSTLSKAPGPWTLHRSPRTGPEARAQIKVSNLHLSVDLAGVAVRPSWAPARKVAFKLLLSRLGRLERHVKSLFYRSLRISSMRT